MILFFQFRAFVAFAFVTHVHKQLSVYLWETPQTPSSHLQTTSDTKRHHHTQTDSSKRHSTSTWTITHPQTAFWMSGDVFGRLLVSVCHFGCPKLSIDVWKRCLRAFKWSVSMFFGFDLSNGVYECSGLAGSSKCSTLEYFRKAKLRPPDTFETSK